MCEFTNALAQTPLWQFALQCYAKHQKALLYWQDTLNVPVNDLLIMAYMQKTEQSLADFWWQEDRIRGVRALLLRIRQLRRQTKGKPGYEVCKQLELELEGVDVLLLQQSLINKSAAATAMVLHYEQQHGLTNGALAPFVLTLISD